MSKLATNRACCSVGRLSGKAQQQGPSAVISCQHPEDRRKFHRCAAEKAIRQQDGIDDLRAGLPGYTSVLRAAYSADISGTCRLFDGDAGESEFHMARNGVSIQQFRLELRCRGDRSEKFRAANHKEADQT